jgi:hypothetical protein
MIEHMDTQSPLATSGLAPPRRRRRWLGCLSLIFSLLTSVVLVLFGAYYYFRYTIDNEWAAAEAEADSLDPRWRLMDIEEDREKVPDDENSALQIMAVTRKAPNFHVNNVKMYDQLFDELPPTAELNEEQLKLLRGQLAKIAEPLKEARRLKDMPRGRFPLTYSDDFISTLVAEQQNARALGDWLYHDAYLLAHEKQYDRAVQSCRAIVNVGRSMGDEPLLISLLIRIAMHAVATESLERVLAQGQASEESLRVMQALLEREIKNNHWLQVMRGERGGNHLLFECIRAGKLHLDEIASPPEKRGRSSAFFRDWFADIGILSHYPGYLRQMNRAVEIAKLPIHDRNARMVDWDAEIRSTKNIASKLMATAMVKAHQADCRGQAVLRSTIAALACERYRLRYKDWPTSLQVLVEKKLLDEIPADPMDNQSIRYRRTEEGVIVYSIGIDLTDSQGNIDRKRPQDPGVDIGFRLWNEKSRRQPPLPVVALPEEK